MLTIISWEAVSEAVHILLLLYIILEGNWDVVFASSCPVLCKQFRVKVIKSNRSGGWKRISRLTMLIWRLLVYAKVWGRARQCQGHILLLNCNIFLSIKRHQASLFHYILMLPRYSVDAGKIQVTIWFCPHWFWNSSECALTLQAGIHFSGYSYM